jgi:divalent metal cation (Fe/Co/Zn/Cd) transporter
MSIEGGVALVTSWEAHSPALLCFGGDSLIELLSAAVVLWRFRFNSRYVLPEKRAARIAGVLLFVLAGIVVLASVLAFLGFREPKPTFFGMALLLAAAFVMPWLATGKRRLAEATASASLRADAAESGYLAWIALAGLLMNAIWRKPWADPVAALLLIPIILREGWEAIRGHACPRC